MLTSISHIACLVSAHGLLIEGGGGGAVSSCRRERLPGKTGTAAINHKDETGERRYHNSYAGRRRELPDDAQLRWHAGQVRGNPPIVIVSLQNNSMRVDEREATSWTLLPMKRRRVP